MPLRKRSPTEALALAAKILDGYAAISRLCGVHRASVQSWIRNGAVPAKYCIDIETACNGVVTCRELNPDAFRPPKPEAIALRDEHAAAATSDS